VVFIEDETIQDIWKPEKPKATTPQVVLDPVSPLLVHDDHGGDDEDAEDRDDATDHGSTSQGHGQPSSDDDEGDDNPPTPPVQQLRRSGRDPVPSTKYPPHQYVLMTDAGEPSCYEEAVFDEHKNEWSEAMQDEIKSLYENDTFDLVSLPKGKKALKQKWVYRVKTEEHSSHPRYKARLVVKGFSQRKGIDFDEIFSPVVTMSSIRVVLGIAATMDLEIEQLDVKTMFLHIDLEVEIYMEQPEGFVVEGKEHQVCKLKKSLYGLKQDPRQWYNKFESFITELGYHKAQPDHYVFTKRYAEGDFIILLLYVDDMLIIGDGIKRIALLKKALSKSFAMKDLE
jgi:ATP-binding cassette subfamily B (MDR/TAP) protein 1